MVTQEYMKLKNMVDWFFENAYIEEMYVKFKEPLRVPQKIFKEEIIGNPDSIAATKNEYYIDQYVYDEVFIENEDEIRVLAKITVTYAESNDKEIMEIYEMMMWRERKN